MVGQRLLTKWHSKYGRATRLAVVTAALAVALPTVAAAQGGAAGGHNGSDAQSTKASPTGDGVPYPEEDWTTVLEDFRQVGGDEYEPVFDSEGHILYQGVNRAPDPSEQTLVAIDRETGDVDWTLPGVSAGCGVVASDDGTIYGTTATVGADAILAIDAATGAITETYDPESDGEEGINPCFESLRLAPDGTLVNLNSLDFAATMHAFDTTGDSLSTKWVRQYNVSGAGADGESTSWLDRPVVSADGSSLYHCRQVPEEHRPDDADDLNMFEKIDLATGALVAEVAIHESAPCDIGGVVAIEGGAIAAASGCCAEYKMLRIVDGGSSLSIAWETIYSRDDDLDESGVGNYPTDFLALSGDTIVFRGAGGGIHTGVDVASGDVMWHYRAGLNGASPAMDAHGNAYIFDHDHVLESFDGDGNPRFAVERADLLGEAATFTTQMTLVGPDGGIFMRGKVRGDHSAFVRVDTGPSQRVAGTTRYDTAAQIALANFSPGVDTVFLAVGTNFPDALTGGPLAAHLGAPVLLTDTNTLPSETHDALDTLRPNNVVALGGPTAVSNEVLADASAAADGAATDRLAGGNRYETAAVIAEQLPASDTVYLAVGTNYPDTLAGGPATDGAPLLLTGTDTLPTKTAEVLAARNPANVIALGGPAAISDAVLDQAGEAADGAATERLAGTTRYGTGIDIAQSVVDAGGFTGTVYVAVGTNYPDAVSAASAAEADGAPIVLTSSDELPAEVATWLAGLDDLVHVVILGGTTAISDGVAGELAALAG